MTMRLSALALLLAAFATPCAGALAAEVSFGDAAHASAEASTPPEDPLATVRALLPGADADVDLGLVGRASAGLAGTEGEAPQPPPFREAVAEAAPPALATVGLLALLQAFGGFRALGVGAVALFSRLAKSELLDNGHRDAVYQLVRASPGLGLSEIGRQTGLGWGTTVYHLDRLERAQMVTSERVGLHRCYFPTGTHGRATRQGMGVLKMETTRSVAAFLAERPGASQTDLCEALGLSASAASKQVTKLERAGLARRERDGKTMRLYPTDGLAPLLSAEPPLPVRAVPVVRDAPVVA